MILFVYMYYLLFDILKIYYDECFMNCEIDLILCVLCILKY